ncbi:hypothetical protein KXD40_002627 [Peronospora effusa]|uniref:Uncharacterized protein n=1 Tax=Peronospora effusa TaxID=542832 RepID=A0A3R7YW54_9STRA|nr:hypothetical protein DD237_008211 [Peronospora effusa]UIZ26492.1 hypothetical protein KXD40_002627 [Peronospora effusa]
MEMVALRSSISSAQADTLVDLATALMTDEVNAVDKMGTTAIFLVEFRMLMLTQVMAARAGRAAVSNI